MNLLGFFFNVYNGLTELDNESRQYIEDNNKNNINVFEYIDIVDITKIIKNLPKKNSKGIDGIPGSVIRECSVQLCYPVSIMLKKIVGDGIFPTKLKETRVVPEHKKKGCVKDVTTHRPVSVSSPTSKIIESCLSKIIFSLVGDGIFQLATWFLPR